MLNYAAALGIMGLLLVVIGQGLVKKAGARKMLTWFGVIGLVIAVVVFAFPGTLPWLDQTINIGGQTFAVAGAGTAGGGTTGVVTTYQPTGSYSAKDNFATTTVSGTSYYKVNNNAATTTAASNLNVGDVVTYWVDNSSGYYWVKPITLTAGPSVTRFEAQAWKNGTASITGYDLVGRASVTGGSTSNISMSANDLANVEITYQGTSKQSAMPFGGVMVVEYNSTISSVTCTGDDLLSINPFHLTYTASATTHTYKAYGVSPTIDDGTASLRKITCQFINGASPAGNEAPYYVKFIPANYYVDQAGNVVLDTEKFSNQDTARVGVQNQPKMTAYWSA